MSFLEKAAVAVEVGDPIECSLDLRIGNEGSYTIDLSDPELRDLVGAMLNVLLLKERTFYGIEVPEPEKP